MSSTYTYDPSTNAGRVRFLVGDTNPTSGIFNDDEITDALTGRTVDEAANHLIRVLMAAAAAKGDVARVAALRDVLALRGGTMPTVAVSFGGHIPTDDGYERPGNT